MRDRVTRDIFGWTNYQEEKPKLGKKRVEIASEPKANFLHWTTK